MAAAFVVGQHVGFSDARAKKFFQPILMSERQSSVGASGGKKSGETRRLRAEGVWRAQALELAKSIRSKEPMLTQEKLAAKIEVEWKSETPCRSSMLIQLISKWEKEGKLPRRNK
jgi:hypothetical protein